MLRRVYESIDAAKRGSSIPADKADSRLRRRTRFDFYFALLFILALHGVSAIKILFILYINYKIAKGLPRAYIPAATWAFNIGTLFSNELCHGYPFERIGAILASGIGASGKKNDLMLLGRRLDSFGGLIPRWEILFNITVLRLISFNMDYYWSLGYQVPKSQVSFDCLLIFSAAMLEVLTVPRRRKSIFQLFRTVKGCGSLPNRLHSMAETTLPTSSTLRCT